MSLLFQLRINLCHFRINCDAAICQAYQLQLWQYNWKCPQDFTDVVVIPTKTNYGHKKYERVHSDCPLYNIEIWSDYKISAGSTGITWIFLLTSTFHLQIATHKEPCSPYPMWASCYLSVHRKMKKGWRTVANVIQVSRKTKGCNILQHITVHLQSRTCILLN
jgi:hypothetical protein